MSGSTALAALRAQAAVTAEGIDALRAWSRGHHASGDALERACARARRHRRAVEHSVGAEPVGPLSPTAVLALSSELDQLLGGATKLVRETNALRVDPRALSADVMVEEAAQGMRHLSRAFDALDERVRATQEPAAPPVAPRLSHIRALDGLRGAAVLAVVLYHFSPDLLPGGFLGVDLFFVLSGFLITSLLVNEWGGTRRIVLPAFWARRARRLLPAMLLVLVAVGIVALLDPDQVGARQVAEDGLAAFTYLANWHFIEAGQSYIAQFAQQDPSPLRHMWSLAIEEQFYLAWPLVVAGIGALVARITSRRDRSRLLGRAVGGVSLVLAVASLLRMVTLHEPGSDPNRVYYGTDSRAHLLLAGAALGALTAGAPTIVALARRRLAMTFGAIAAVGLGGLMVTVGPDESWLYEGGYGAVTVAIVLVLVAAAQPGSNLLGRLFETRGLVALGLVSYGVYLWHWPAVVWLTESSTGLDEPMLFALRAVATGVAATASYFLVEMPIRRGRLLRSKPRTATGGSPVGVAPATMVTVVAVVLLVPALAFPAFVEAPEAAAPTAVADITAAYRQSPRCDTGAGTGTAADAPAPRVTLVGNSIAEELVPCLRTILERRGGSLIPLVANAVPLCHFRDDIRRQVRRPEERRPQAAIVFVYPAPCEDGDGWDAQVKEAVRLWTDADVRVYLAPFVPTPYVNDEFTLRFEEVGTLYRSLAESDPAVTVLDAGPFLRDAAGQYQWRMPCLSPGELGCDEDGTLVVRFPNDGFHFCADPAWVPPPCAPRFRGGQRRVAAAIAQQLLATERGT